MRQIFMTTYELIGEAIPIAKAHFAAVEDSKALSFRIAEDFGADGFRPSRYGGRPTSLFFKGEIPTGWRRVGRQGELIEARPNKATKAGRAAEKALSEHPGGPECSDLAHSLGYNPNEIAMDTSRGVIYFPSSLHVSFPSSRYFIRIPRFDGDAFEPDETRLAAVPESTLMKALEDHNAEARRQKLDRVA